MIYAEYYNANGTLAHHAVVADQCEAARLADGRAYATYNMGAHAIGAPLIAQKTEG